jgi:hypothetical protein
MAVSCGMLDVLGLLDLFVRFSHRSSPLVYDVGRPCRERRMARKWAE